MEDAETRYRQAAADYLGLPLDHPRVVWAARQAQAVAEAAAFDYLRSLQKKTSRKEMDACGWPYMLASVRGIAIKTRKPN